MKMLLALFEVGSGLAGCLFLIAFSLLLGPWCFAYDLNHLLPLAFHHTYHIEWWNLAVLLVGFLLARIWVPIALIVWVLVSVGVLS